MVGHRERVEICLLHEGFESARLTTTVFNWREFLEGYNEEILSVEEHRNCLPAETLASGWLGFPEATEAELLAAETRLNLRLPSSYRQFLATTNGWHTPSWFVYELLPASKITWFRENHQQWIDAYVGPAKGSRRLSDVEYLIYGDKQSTTHFREEYLQTALQISEVGDSAIMLLNPEIITSSGEWEAWVFANWYPGAVRFPSFLDMMVSEREAFVRLKNDKPSLPGQDGT